MLKQIAVIALLVPAFCQGVIAQSEQEKKIKAEIWDKAPAAFKATAVPQKWENESAVLLATSIDYHADFATKMVGLSVTQFYVEKVTSHHRVKLLDKAAVKEFSELSFNEKYVNTNIFGKSSSYFIIAVKVIKANGTEKEIDLSQAVKADSDNRKEQKIAIPDLEPGDILDYFSAGKQEYVVGTEGSISDNFLMEGEYPVVKRHIQFRLPQEYEIESKVFNGAPNFVKSFEERDVIYTLEDDMREKAADLLWCFKHRTAPEIRYKKKRRDSYGSLESSANGYAGGFGYNVSNIGFIMDYKNKNKELKKEKDAKKLTYEMYYLLRNPIYLQAYFGIEQGRPLDVTFVGDEYYRLVNKFLSKNKISHNIMVIPSREYGPLEDQITLNYADVVVRVNTSPPIYLPRIKPFSMPNEINTDYEGVPAIISPSYPRDDYAGSEEKSVPAGTAADNSTTTTMMVTLNAEDNSKMDVQRDVLSKGHNKEAHQYMVVTNYDYMKEYDLPKYQVQSSHLIGGILKQYNKEQEKLQQRLTQDYNERDQKLKDDIESSMSVKVSEYKNFKLKSIGMWDETPYNEYRDEFTLENMTKKAGPNYILELPKLIEKQTEITEKQRTRTQDIYMNYARSYVNEISFKIPEGYTIEGIENLNKDVQNETGGFVSTAKVEGDMLKITSKKFYSANYFPAKDWEKMLLFLDAAVEFSNAKVLLKKS
jgi:hypothetical protein